jgi:hypothetical protein
MAVFRFELRVPLELKTSEEFKALVRDKFLLGGNPSFRLVDVSEQLTEHDGALVTEVARLIHYHGSQLVLNRSEWV